jgi:O-antigen ligase
MTGIFLFIVLVFAALPSLYVAAALPALWISQSTLLGKNAVLFSVGSVDVTVVDLVLVMLFVKLCSSALWRRELVANRLLYAAVAGFVLVNLLATLAGGAKFGEAHMSRCLTSLARLLSEIAIIPILAQAVQTLPQAKRCIGIVLATLGVLAAIQFINLFGASHGITIGEVQGIERGEIRYFGPVGDSVGAVLLLGYVASLCFMSFVGIGAFLTGILLTAGLGAIFAAGVATVLFLLLGARTETVRISVRQKLWLMPALAFVVLLAAVTFAKPLSKTLFDRISTGNASVSGGQRVANAEAATAMLTDNPLLGVGFMGYEDVLGRYGGAKYFDLDHPTGATANANNQIFQSLTDGGICGLLAFGALVVCAARLLMRIARCCEDRFVATFFLAAFIWLLAQIFGNLAAVWLNPSSYVARLLWVVLGLGVAVQRLLPKTNSQPVPTAAESENAQLVPA